MMVLFFLPRTRLHLMEKQEAKKWCCTCVVGGKIPALFSGATGLVWAFGREICKFEKKKESEKSFS